MKLNIVTGKIQRAQRVCFYGVESVGKTTLAARMPDPVFLDVEKGSAHLDVPRQEVKTWTELLEVVKELASGSYGYKTVVLDSIDWAERLNHSDLCEQKKIKSLEEIPYGKGFTMAAERMARFLNDLDRLVDAGIHVVLVGHAHVKRQEPPDQVQAFDRYELKLTKQASPLVKEWVDHLFFLNFKTRIVESESGKAKGRGGKERVLYTTHTAAYDAKTRSELADELPLDYASISSLFGAVKAPAKAVAVEILGREHKETKEALAVYLDPHEADVNAWCLSTGKITKGQTWRDMPPSFLAQVEKRPEDFLQAVAKKAA
jgi:hypothetical protein